MSDSSRPRKIDGPIDIYQSSWHYCPKCLSKNEDLQRGEQFPRPGTPTWCVKCGWEGRWDETSRNRPLGRDQ